MGTGKLIEGVWDCKGCGTVRILGRYRECPHCGKVRDSNVKFYMSDKKMYVPEEQAKTISRRLQLKKHKRKKSKQKKMKELQIFQKHMKRL